MMHMCARTYTHTHTKINRHVSRRIELKCIFLMKRNITWKYSASCTLLLKYICVLRINNPGQ